ncbi:MAG TPA: hypothetical protein EYQ22_01680 [Gammaproteobacteria bacterium]|jgi:hypothetical protein|nr:hypothetical protein [Gammaproteobacteria bacterium]HIK71295.1 hypothetical protein [Pseudomonadales bacterium]|tara:strand:- start:1107 stop:1307 length:201 start_codon:yes stop_codon:yes gene_type:complete
MIFLRKSRHYYVLITSFDEAALWLPISQQAGTLIKAVPLWSAMIDNRQVSVNAKHNPEHTMLTALD